LSNLYALTILEANILLMNPHLLLTTILPASAYAKSAQDLMSASWFEFTSPAHIGFRARWIWEEHSRQTAGDHPANDHLACP
jgi:hypothetical protein